MRDNADDAPPPEAADMPSVLEPDELDDTGDYPHAAWGLEVEGDTGDRE